MLPHIKSPFQIDERRFCALFVSLCLRLPNCPFLLSSCRLSSSVPFACSRRNRLSVVFILLVNGPHITGSGKPICPDFDGCILRFL